MFHDEMSLYWCCVMALTGCQAINVLSNIQQLMANPSTSVR